MTTYQQKITFGEMHASVVRDVLRSIARGRCRVHETVRIDAMVSNYEPANLCA